MKSEKLLGFFLNLLCKGIAWAVVLIVGTCAMVTLLFATVFTGARNEFKKNRGI